MDKAHASKEYSDIKMNDHRFRGSDVKLMNDVENILKISAIVEDQIKRTEKLDSELIQTISIVLTHNPFYFTKYFHKSLFEFINSNRCDEVDAQILLRTLYKDLFREPYINFETRHQEESQRYIVMNERISKAINYENDLAELCTTVDSFLNRKMSFNEGEIIGTWGNSAKRTTIRKMEDGRLFMILSFSDNAFPSRKEIEYNALGELQYKLPYTSKRWKINTNGALELKHSKDQESVIYPAYINTSKTGL